MIFPDEGYFFGIGAFETIAVENGQPVLLSAHYRRLMRAADFFSLKISMEEIRRKVEQALDQPGLRSGRKALKITASPENLLVTARDNPYRERDYDAGFVVGFSAIRRNESSPLTYHKTLNYADSLMEKHAAQKRGVDEPVFLNTRGYLAEGAATNLFFVRDGKLYTPPISCGLLPGIVRDFLCHCYSVAEREILPSQIPEFDEMFLTNSLLGIMPVQGFADVPLPAQLMETGAAAAQGHRFATRETADRLLAAYREKYCRPSGSLLS